MCFQMLCWQRWLSMWETGALCEHSFCRLLTTWLSCCLGSRFVALSLSTPCVVGCLSVLHWKFTFHLGSWFFLCLVANMFSCVAKKFCVLSFNFVYLNVLQIDLFCFSNFIIKCKIIFLNNETSKNRRRKKISKCWTCSPPGILLFSSLWCLAWSCVSLYLQCPMYKTDESGKQVPEKFAEECKYFTESRLLQRDVKIILEGVSNQNLLGTVLHPVSSWK